MLGGLDLEDSLGDFSELDDDCDVLCKKNVIDFVVVGMMIVDEKLELFEERALRLFES